MKTLVKLAACPRADCGGNLYRDTDGKLICLLCGRDATPLAREAGNAVR